MADKTIGELPIAPSLNEDSLMVVEQQGQAMSMRGKTFADFARESAAADVQRAVDAANAAEKSAKEASQSVSSIGTAVEDAQGYAQKAGASAEKAEQALSTVTQAKNDAEAAAETATTKAEDAAQSAQEAKGAASTAAQDAVDAADTLLQGYVETAESAKDAAKASQDAASQSAAAAQGSAAEANASAGRAEQAAEQAVSETSELLQGYVDEANSAKNAAKESQTAAETAKDDAVTAGAAATESAEQAAASAETAQQYSGNPPQIGEDGTWETWDAESGAYTGTNKPSRGVQGEHGEPGVSPMVSTSKVGKTTTVTITDANGEHTFDIKDGADGTGAGDMTKEMYDPEKHEQDIFKYVDDAVKNVTVEVDPVPTPESEKAVQSGGVYTALQSKADLGEGNKLKPGQLPDNIDAATLEGNDADYFATDVLTDEEIKTAWNEVFTEVSA